METALFAAGCFWGVERSFSRIEGVSKTSVGYCGGQLAEPTYEEVCTGNTGHAETVQVEYEASAVSYEDLLETFWRIHDPTSLDRQGADVGTQYRSVIFYSDEDQAQAAMSARDELETSGRYREPIVTDVVPAQIFWPAEEYHQKYFEKQRQRWG